MVRPAVAMVLALIALVVGSALVSASAAPLAGQSASGKQTEISCLNESGRSHVPKQQPKRCALFGPGGAFAGGVNLAQLSWNGWGGAQATGRGIEKGFHLPATHIQVQVVAFKRVSCGGVYRYAKLRSTSRYGTTTAAAPTC